MQHRRGVRRRPLVATLITSLGLGMVPLLSPPAGALAPTGGTVFVNEVHYDNDGTDVGEAIEIAGPAGTDLSGWSIVLYNGSGGAVYGTRALSGVIPDQQAGFGTVALTYPSNGIQNGAPDGIALVDGAGQVVQLLSYEGTFAAVGGPANGLTTTDIGVAETASTAVGASLQLTGNGTTYGAFTWAAPTASSFGAVNAGQIFGGGGGTPPPPPDPCAATVTHQIGAVQGPGAASPLGGSTVTVEGVVVGDFQGASQLNGVFLQDADGDGDPVTSDGIFVFGGPPATLAAGDVVRVTGTVEELSLIHI